MFRALAAFTLLGAACTTSAIKADFAALHDCEPSDVDVEPTDFRQRVASGCGATDEYYCRPDDGCKGVRAVVARRHSAQFGCGPGDVAVRKLEGGAWLADGCGSALTYQCIANTRNTRYDDPVLRCIAETTEAVR